MNNRTKELEALLKMVPSKKASGKKTPFEGSYGKVVTFKKPVRITRDIIPENTRQIICESDAYIESNAFDGIEIVSFKFAGHLIVEKNVFFAEDIRNIDIKYSSASEKFVYLNSKAFQEMDFQGEKDVYVKLGNEYKDSLFSIYYSLLMMEKSSSAYAYAKEAFTDVFAFNFNLYDEYDGTIGEWHLEKINKILTFTEEKRSSAIREYKDSEVDMDYDEIEELNILGSPEELFQRPYFEKLSSDYVFNENYSIKKNSILITENNNKLEFYERATDDDECSMNRVRDRLAKLSVLSGCSSFNLTDEHIDIISDFMYDNYDIDDRCDYMATLEALLIFGIEFTKITNKSKQKGEK